MIKVAYYAKEYPILWDSFRCQGGYTARSCSFSRQRLPISRENRIGLWIRTPTLRNEQHRVADISFSRRRIVLNLSRAVAWRRATLSAYAWTKILRCSMLRQRIWWSKQDLPRLSSKPILSAQILQKPGRIKRTSRLAISPDQAIGLDRKTRVVGQGIRVPSALEPDAPPRCEVETALRPRSELCFPREPSLSNLSNLVLSCVRKVNKALRHSRWAWLAIFFPWQQLI